MAKQHRRFEPADKITILREHLLEGRPLSQVCDKYSIAPTRFYQWRKVLFENGAAAQRYRLCDAQGQTRWPGRGDPRGTRDQTGGRKGGPQDLAESIVIRQS